MFSKGATGMEMMLRNLGLGEVLDAAKHLAQSGAVQKIILFADGLEETNERLARIEKALGIEAPERDGGDAAGLLAAPVNANSGSSTGGVAAE